MTARSHTRLAKNERRRIARKRRVREEVEARRLRALRPVVD